MSSGAPKPASQEIVLFAASLSLVVLVAFAAAQGANTLFYAIVGSAAVATGLSRSLFPRGTFFALTFANLTAVYAAIFAFFMEELFQLVRPGVAGLGFTLPLGGFILGCFLRRHEIRRVLEHADIGSSLAVYRALVWLAPVSAVGMTMFALSSLAEPFVNTNMAFLAAMLAIAVIVFVVSPNVARFLVEAGLLFDEFMQRMARLVVPAFAFLTFYSMLVIAFSSSYSLIGHFGGGPHFRVGGALRSITFSEAIHFSIVTISTVGYGDIVPISNVARVLASAEVICGVILLMFGVSELLEFSREHRRQGREHGG